MYVLVDPQSRIICFAIIVAYKVKKLNGQRSRNGWPTIEGGPSSDSSPRDRRSSLGSRTRVIVKQDYHELVLNRTEHLRVGLYS